MACNNSSGDGGEVGVSFGWKATLQNSLRKNKSLANARYFQLVRARPAWWVMLSTH